jgi:N4-gp56 family major capsid protein
MAGPMKYNAPAEGTESSIAAAATATSPAGNQIRTDYFYKQALIEARKEQYFTQLADARAMPKNMGKKIVQYHYLPLLDDRNINDQGIDALGLTSANGNLYGSSKDVGTISGKLPALSETGGRVNRVGFKRKTIEGTFEKFGFFDEYTQESLDFDSDDQLEQHIAREMVNGASEMTEDALQIDLLNSAGVVRLCGAALSVGAMNATSLVAYGDLMRLSIDLDNNRTPKQTTAFTGTRQIDTKTIPGARAMYVGSELIPTLKAMKDLFNNPAFIPVEKYAAGGQTLTGEIGAIDQFRIVVVPEMMKWAGAGAATAGNTTMYSTGSKFDVFPMLVIGEGSFTTISFQTDGKGVKFTIYSRKPGEAAADKDDPYGETGFMSIKWYYGFMALRPERLGLIKTVAAI